MSPQDFAYQARRSAEVTYATSDGKGDTYTRNLFDTNTQGAQAGIDKADGSDTDGYFDYLGPSMFSWATGWEDVDYARTRYYFDTPDGWGSYIMWNFDGKPDGVGYYKVG